MSGTAFEAARHELPGLQAQMEQYLQSGPANLNNAMALSAYNRDIARLAMRDITLFTQVGALRLRSYQCDVARAVLRSVFTGAGDSLVVVLPRQSGKNELQAHIEAMLLLLNSESKGEMVKISPTWKPQSQNAMHRLERVLSANILTRNRWEKHSGYIYSIGTAR